MRIKDSVFIVTGGASGLGAATVRMLVAHGGRVVMADVKEPEGRTLQAELGAAARFVSTDVTSEASARQCVESTLAVFGGLHGLVNCAGVVHGEKIIGKEGPHRLDTFARVININLIGSFNLTRLAADAMSRAGAASSSTPPRWLRSRGRSVRRRMPRRRAVWWL